MKIALDTYIHKTEIVDYYTHNIDIDTHVISAFGMNAYINRGRKSFDISGTYLVHSAVILNDYVLIHLVKDDSLSIVVQIHNTQPYKVDVVLIISDYHWWKCYSKLPLANNEISQSLISSQIDQLMKIIHDIPFRNIPLDAITIYSDECESGAIDEVYLFNFAYNQLLYATEFD